MPSLKLVEPDEAFDPFKQYPASVIPEVEVAYVNSVLGVWMAGHRDEFLVLMRGFCWDWGAAADHFGKIGLTDLHGAAPTATTTAGTWRRLLVL
jgi:hypothetical protein